MKLRTLWVAALALSLAVTACGEWAFAQSRSTSSYRGGYGPATQVAATEEMPSRMTASSAKPSQSTAAPKTSSGGDVGYMSGYSQGCGCQGGPCGCDQGCCDSGCCQSDCCSNDCC